MAENIRIPEKLEELVKNLKRKRGYHFPQIEIFSVKLIGLSKYWDRQHLIDFSYRSIIKENEEDILNYMLILCKDFELGEYRSVKKKVGYFPYKDKDNKSDYYIVMLYFNRKPYRGSINEVVPFYTEDQDLVFKLINELLKDKIETYRQRYDRR